MTQTWKEATKKSDYTAIVHKNALITSTEIIPLEHVTPKTAWSCSKTHLLLAAKLTQSAHALCQSILGKSTAIPLIKCDMDSTVAQALHYCEHSARL
jgi:hypothetical protein